MSAGRNMQVSQGRIQNPTDGGCLIHPVVPKGHRLLGESRGMLPREILKIAH